MTHDLIACADEALPGEPLLEPVMKAGARVGAVDEDLKAVRARAAQQIALLPASVRALEPARPPYPVELSAGLRAYSVAVRRHLGVD